MTSDVFSARLRVCGEAAYSPMGSRFFHWLFIYTLRLRSLKQPLHFLSVLNQVLVLLFVRVR